MRQSGMRTAALLLFLILLLVFGGCSRSPASQEDPALPSATEEASAEAEAPQDVIYLSMATSGNWEDIARGRLWDEYTRKLSEWSGGKLQMRSYFNGSLGTDLELIEGVSEGTLCIINSVPSYQISVVPEAALLDVPGLFDSIEEYNYFIDNYYMETLQSYYQKHGIRLLASSAFDYRVLTSNRPVRSREELQGLKLRTMENKYQMAFWQALGATVISMNFNQARLAIQQDLLEAQENPLGYMVSTGLSDLQNQVILTNHVLMINNYLMNEEQYQALSDENKELLHRFLNEMDAQLVQEQPMDNEKLVEQLRSEGIEIYDASGDIRNAIRDIGRNRVLEMLREDLGAAVVDDFLAKVEQSREAFAKEQKS